MTTTLLIDGMNCSYCVRALTDALQSVPGVTRATVSLDREEAVIEHEPGEASVLILVARVEQEGYGVSPQ